MIEYYRALKKRLAALFLASPKPIDTFLLAVLTILIAYQPFYLHGRINEFELGLYLPGISSVLDGLIPYKDFFHLRGPLELYIPAFFMSLFGENVALLSTYFYVGTLVTLVLGIYIARHLYQTRLVLYLMALVFIGRTFPRVIFTFWGGMRFGWGLLSILCLVIYYKKNKNILLFLAGISSGLALLTSVEMGVVCVASVVATSVFSLIFGFYPWSKTLKNTGWYLSGLASLLLPYLLYLLGINSLWPYLHNTYIVVSQMQKIIPIHLIGDTPDNIIALLKSLWPSHGHFKHMTPIYCYLFFAIYIYKRLRRRDLLVKDLGIIHVAFYGIIMYILAFRNFESGQFEMALQPEKILLFYLLEKAFLYLNVKRYGMTNHKWRARGLGILIFLFILSSIAYPVQRYNHRFPSFKCARAFLSGQDINALRPLSEDASKKLELSRAYGMTVPLDQAEDFEKVSQFFEQHTRPDEPVFMFPELGFYSFLIDRPFLSHFPMATFSWLTPEWHDKLMRTLKSKSPHFIVAPHELPHKFNNLYFLVEQNKLNYEEVEVFIHNNYKKVLTTPHLDIYQRINF